VDEGQRTRQVRCGGDHCIYGHGEEFRHS
jgi:hypothetical protein